MFRGNEICSGGMHYVSGDGIMFKGNELCSWGMKYV